MWCNNLVVQGGIKAVMWTDAFQIIMMFAGLIAVLIQGSVDMGGFGNIWQVMVDRNRTDFWK
jgi:sodium-coupled monocarboxylate transporter 8/12